MLPKKVTEAGQLLSTCISREVGGGETQGRGKKLSHLMAGFQTEGPEFCYPW